MKNLTKKQWALILGGSSGLGLATAKKLAANGYSIFIIHRDRRADLEEVKFNFQEITSSGVDLVSYNVDLVKTDKRQQVLKEIKTKLGAQGKLKVLVHSIAKGNLKPMNSQTEKELENVDFQITLNAMAISLYDWTKDLIKVDLFSKDARIISFTSEGNSRAWEGYAAVSAAKATLESLTRNMALEFASLGLKVNCIQAGVTETKSFKMIPGHKRIKENALQRNPQGRLTSPEDVANVVYLLTTPEAQWITGSVIKVDGGESLR
ncbi:SDR family NAD(P)-dependent oxidoreductase [Euzebyella saccharophila]|uniref:SDR family NAD(P)-dependent oxidoreductase n=1 Tax=Euzebyella saccharophila TaxID=679664 RepID=A0ABV8JSV3_9FLAO|nr:SDR family oxidoreductase [Euzebyella saccharophila]